MRKILLVIACFGLSAISFGQKKALDKAADSTCKCMGQVKEKIKSSADFEKAAQGCIITSALPFFEEISKEENIPLEDLDKDQGQKLGEKIGLKLVVSCPVFMELATQYSGDDDEDKGVTGETKGMVTTVEITDHVYLNVKDQSGKINKLLWLEYFPGSDDYKSSPAALKGKTVSVKWKQVELYMLKQKDFIVVKAITNLAVK